MSAQRRWSGRARWGGWPSSASGRSAARWRWARGSPARSPRSSPGAAPGRSSSARRRWASSIARRASTAEAARGAARGGAGDAGAQPGRGGGGDRAASWTTGALVFDVGSVKAAAIASVEPKLRPGAYVACHPIAGTERVGPDAASPLLFEGKRCVICPTPRSNEAGRRDGRAAVDRDGRRAGADDGRAARPRVRGGQPPAARGGLFAGGGARPALRPTSRGAPAAADVQPARHDARRRVEPGDVARHLPRQPRRGAAADRGAGGLRARSCARRSRPATPDRIEKLLGAGKAGRDRLVAG